MNNSYNMWLKIGGKDSNNLRIENGKLKGFSVNCRDAPLWRRDSSRLYSITYVRGTRFEIAVSKWYGILPMDRAMSSMRFASP